MPRFGACFDCRRLAALYVDAANVRLAAGIGRRLRALLRRGLARRSSLRYIVTPPPAAGAPSLECCTSTIRRGKELREDAEVRDLRDARQARRRILRVERGAESVRQAP